MCVVVFNHWVYVRAIRHAVNCRGQHFLLLCALHTAYSVPAAAAIKKGKQGNSCCDQMLLLHTACFTCNIWCLHNLPQHVYCLHQSPSANAQQEGAAQ